MKNFNRIFLSLILIALSGSISAQSKSTYKVNGTTYVNGERYTTTGEPKVERSSSARDEFLKSKGYTKVPSGYQVDHVVPLSEGGRDVPSNMQLISTEEHKRKTASERNTSSSSTYFKPAYKSNSTYRAPAYKKNSTYRSANYGGSNSYSKPSYSSTPSRTIQTGSRGGQYYINSNGNKTYIKRK